LVQNLQGSVESNLTLWQPAQQNILGWKFKSHAPERAHVARSDVLSVTNDVNLNPSRNSQFSSAFTKNLFGTDGQKHTVRRQSGLNFLPDCVPFQLFRSGKLSWPATQIIGHDGFNVPRHFREFRRAMFVLLKQAQQLLFQLLKPLRI